MSSYLVAFAVTDFESVDSDPTGNGVKVSIWARPNAIDQAEYARSIGGAIQAAFERIFDTPYPLPKQV